MRGGHGLEVRDGVERPTLFPCAGVLAAPGPPPALIRPPCLALALVTTTTVVNDYRAIIRAMSETLTLLSSFRASSSNLVPF
jgi:hypothetical protein